MIPYWNEVAFNDSKRGLYYGAPYILNGIGIFLKNMPYLRIWLAPTIVR